MRIIRRFVFTAAFLCAAVLLIRVAKQYGDFLFLFYPGIMREVQLILSELTQKLDYVLWERVALIALVWAAVMLILDIIFQENLLRWVSGVTAVLAFLLCAYVGLAGLNHYAPSVAEGMRLEVRSDYTEAELKRAAAYYLDGANGAAQEVERSADGLFDAAPFETLSTQVESGMKNMVRTSYVFGGSTIPVKPLKLTARYEITSVFCCFTGECCVNPSVQDLVLPFVMTQETARRMSIERADDSAFLSVLSCTASDSADFRYSGYIMAYYYCMEALRAQDAEAADAVAKDESDEVRADLASMQPMKDLSLGEKWLERMEQLDNKEIEQTKAEPADLASLLIGWQLHQTAPAA